MTDESEKCEVCGTALDWRNCEECGGEGGAFDKNDEWHDCETCDGQQGESSCPNEENHPVAN